MAGRMESSWDNRASPLSPKKAASASGSTAKEAIDAEEFASEAGREVQCATHRHTDTWSVFPAQVLMQML